MNLVCNKVYSYLNDNLGNGNRNANETLFELSKEASNAILFVDYKKLRYPTVRVSAKRIAQRFGIEEDMEKYYKCREVLEQMISIDTIENENIENRLMNQLLLLLTMLQVLPTLYQVTRSLLQQKVSLLTIGSGIIGSPDASYYIVSIECAIAEHNGKVARDYSGNKKAVKEAENEWF